MAKVIIIGGGPAGCEAAHQLANQGIEVELVEKSNETGGNLNNWYQLFPDRKYAKDLNTILKGHLEHPNIRLHIGMEPKKIEKSKTGKFNVPLTDGSLLEGDSLLVATGFKIFDARRKEEYGYGIYENVITSVELENMFYNHAITMAGGNAPKRVGIIHCVGSRDEKVCNYHCSKLCCITGVKQANCCPRQRFSVFTWICECSDRDTRRCTGKRRKNTISSSSADDCPKLPRICRNNCRSR